MSRVETWSAQVVRVVPLPDSGQTEGAGWRRARGGACRRVRFSARFENEPRGLPADWRRGVREREAALLREGAPGETTPGRENRGSLLDTRHQRCQADVGGSGDDSTQLDLQSGVQGRGLGWREGLASSAWKRFTIVTRMRSLRQEGDPAAELQSRGGEEGEGSCSTEGGRGLAVDGARL